MNQLGHMKVRKFLARERLEWADNADDWLPGERVVAQYTSLGSLTPKWLAEFRASLAPGMVTTPLSLVWPTTGTSLCGRGGIFLILLFLGLRVCVVYVGLC
jgi:hypothetical protein